MRNQIAKVYRAAKDWASGHRRSSHWPATRKAHLAKEPNCQWCGSDKDPEVHHMQPYHLQPQLELVDSNLITLCESMGVQCHLRRGHLGNWKDYNPRIREECERQKRLWGMIT